MKFSNLTSNMRSMLTALAASNHLNTEQLGRACMPQISAASAANVLCEMRKNGIAYSMQKPENKQYADWSITSVGKAVFEGRPDTDVRVNHVPDVADKSAYTDSKFIVGATGHVSAPCASRDDALATAQHRATEEPGKAFRVYELIAVANMPVPQAQITLL